MPGSRAEDTTVAPAGLVRELFLEALARGQEIQVETHGGSMWPTLRHGQRLRVERLTEAGPALGDILVYDREGSWVCHRLVDTRPKREWREVQHCVLRGDARRSVDAPVPVGRIVGRVAGVGARKRAPSRLMSHLYLNRPALCRMGANIAQLALLALRRLRRLAALRG